jgi:hypothetical protein
VSQDAVVVCPEAYGGVYHPGVQLLYVAKLRRRRWWKLDVLHWASRGLEKDLKTEPAVVPGLRPEKNSKRRIRNRQNRRDFLPIRNPYAYA